MVLIPCGERRPFSASKNEFYKWGVLALFTSGAASQILNKPRNCRTLQLSSSLVARDNDGAILGYLGLTLISGLSRPGMTRAQISCTSSS
jgi:hypothetical protein